MWTLLIIASLWIDSEYNATRQIDTVKIMGDFASKKECDIAAIAYAIASPRTVRHICVQQVQEGNNNGKAN